MMTTFEIFSAIVIGFTTLAGFWISAKIGYKAAIKSALINKGHPITKSTFLFTLKSIMKIKEYVEDMFNLTTADRFLILTAHNGGDNLRFASAIYEQHNANKEVQLSFGAISKYVHFEFDEPYRKFLKDAENNGCIHLNIETMPACDLKHIYMGENVRISSIYHLKRIKNYDNKENDIIFYCSIAKHDGIEYSDTEKVLHKSTVSKIKENIENNFLLA